MLILRVIPQFMLPYEQKGKSLKISVSIGLIKCFAVSTVKQVFECCLPALTQLHNRFATRLPTICCLKSAVPVYKVAIVVIETTQLVLSQLKTFYRIHWRIE